MKNTQNSGVFSESKIGFTNLMQLSAEKYRTRGMNQILKLTIFLALCCVVRGQCEGLTMYEGDTKINTSTVCIRQYNTTETIDFYENFNQSMLPQDFPTSNSSDSVDRPSSIHVKGIETPIVENSEDYMYPGLAVQWQPPFSGAGKSLCYGYLVAWFTEDRSVNMCQLFHINKMPGRMLLFQFNIKEVSQKTVFAVRVYSMPPPGPEAKEDVRSFVSAQIATPVAYKSGTPSDWAPFVAYDILNNGTVKLTISLPPPEFNMTGFTAYLDYNGNTTVDSVKVTSELRTEQNTEFSLSLTARRSGSYVAVVWVRDELKAGQCQCWAWQNGVKTCKSACGGTRTSLFYVNITNPPTDAPALPATSTVVDSTIPSSSTTANPTFAPENKPDNLAVILGVIFAVLALVAILMCVFCLFRNKSKVKGWIRHLVHHYQPPEGFENHMSRTDPDPIDGSAPTLSRKTIYLVSADDHEAHVSLVEALALFLEVHCHCNVILPSRIDPNETRTYEWFLSSINKSDFIMFVDSKGAQKMIDAHLKQKSYTNRTVGPEGDLFIFSLKHILRNVEVREQSLILVSFNGNRCQTYLEVPYVFLLPEHLHYLLKKIHRLNSSAISLYSKILPLNVKDIEILPEGAEMLAARNYVKFYEENNPQCFENNFGDLKDMKPQCGLKDMKPECNRYVSIDSGYPDDDRLDSVSQQVSFSGSPTAIPEHICYTAPHAHSPNKADFKDTMSDAVGSVYTNGGLSCYTIKEIHERMDEIKQEPDLDKFSVVPPESASQIVFDSLSTAMSALNKNNYEDDEGMGIDENDSFQQGIIPPENPLDIQLDTVSSAFADINANADKLLLQGDTKFLFEDETMGSLSQFDSISL